MPDESIEEPFYAYYLLLFIISVNINTVEGAIFGIFVLLLTLRKKNKNYTINQLWRSFNLRGLTVKRFKVKIVF